MTTAPILPPRAAKLFRAFTSSANTGVLHPLDWQRFYHFVRWCHTKRVKATEADIAMLLESSGFTQEYAEEIAMVYEHGRSILATR